MSEDNRFYRTNWLMSFMESAKVKSKNVIDVIKGDLVEFKTTMSNDASNLLFSGYSKVDGSLSKSITESFNEMKTNTNIILSDNKEELNVKKEENMILLMNERLLKEIESLKHDERTYILEPNGNDYSKWIEKFNPDEFKEEISNLLIENSSIRLIYSKIVF